MNGSDLVLRNSEAENTWHECSHQLHKLNTVVLCALPHTHVLFDLVFAETNPHFTDDSEAQRRVEQLSHGD